MIGGSESLGEEREERREYSIREIEGEGETGDGRRQKEWIERGDMYRV